MILYNLLLLLILIISLIISIIHLSNLNYKKKNLKPHSSSEPEPHSSSEPEPHSSSEPEPHSSSEPEPHSSSEPEPHSSSEPEPHSSSEPEPHSSSEPEPINYEKNTIVFENTSDKPIIVHLDVNKPPCGIGKDGACNPPDSNGNCIKKEPAIPGSSDINYGVNNCGYNKNEQINGNIDKIWGNGPELSGTKFFVIDKNGNKNQKKIRPAQRLEPKEKWLLQLPISNDGSGKAVWCFRHAEPGNPGSNNMECSGSGAWFTPDNTIEATSPMGVQRVEFNVNTKDTWNNWVLNLSAVDAINSNIIADLNNNSKNCKSFKCPINLQNCPSDNKGMPTLSSQGKNIKYPSCIAPKLIGAPEYNTINKIGPCWNNSQQKISDDNCWAAAGSGLGNKKLDYHKSWDYTSKNIKPLAKNWKEFIRPNKPGEDNNCETYTWAYDEQVCSLKEYDNNGQCSIDKDNNLVNALDNPYTPLGTCNVYKNGIYQNPNINIKVNNVLDKW